ncbi:MAG: hypothetical protein VX794_03565 [Nitrospinota bacterium]|nr:hypothetical protein [Nitrospinota bacterium]
MKRRKERSKKIFSNSFHASSVNSLPLHKSDRELRKLQIKEWMDVNLPPVGTKEWEELCTGCGKCCCNKEWRGKKLVALKSFCKFLNLTTNQCSVYESRFSCEPLCSQIDCDIIEMGALPEDCPYVVDLPGYKGPLLVDN